MHAFSWPGLTHYENLPMRCMEIFFSIVKTENFIRKKKKKKPYSNIFSQNVDCGYTLRPLYVLDKEITKIDQVLLYKSGV